MELLSRRATGKADLMDLSPLTTEKYVHHCSALHFCHCEDPAARSNHCFAPVDTATSVAAEVALWALSSQVESEEAQNALPFRSETKIQAGAIRRL